MSRVGLTNVVINAPTKGSAVAYDPLNDRYLVVSSHGLVWGRFVSGTGEPLGAQFPLGGAAYGHYPRVAYSPHMAGGAGGFLVVWFESDTSPWTSVHARTVSSFGVLGPDVQLEPNTSFWEGGGAVSYSTVSQEFLVAWPGAGRSSIRGMRVSNAGTPLAASFPIAADDYVDNPNIAYNPSADEWMLVHSGYRTFAYINSVRIKPGSGALLGANTVGTGAAIYITDVAFNAATGLYLAAWYQNPPGIMYGRLLNPDGSGNGDVIALSNRYKAYDALSVARNPISGTFFAVSHDAIGTQDGGVELNSFGQPLTTGVQVTDITGTGNFFPRLAASSARPDWYVSAANVFSSTIGQRITTATTGGGGGGTPPPPPPPGPEPCSYTINPASISIGGAAADGTLFVSTQSHCAWEAAGNGFITFQNGTGRVGSGGVAFNIAANPSSTMRVGETTVAGQTFQVTQGPACIFDIAPTSISIGAGATDGNVILTAPTGCGWAASSHSAFMTFTGTKSGTGSASLPFTIAANPSTIARTGSATIAGRTLTINQAGGPFDAAARARENARADFDGNGESDLLLQNLNTGSLGAWLFADLTVAATPSLSHGLVDYTNWRLMGTGDFNSDGQPDIVLQHLAEGWIFVWYMNGTTRAGATYTSFHRLVDVRWRIVAVGDMNQDGKPDIVWQHPDGWLALWLMNGVTLIASVPLTPGSVQDVQWRIAGMGDFNGDGKNDLLWRHTGRGDLGVWFMNGSTRIGFSPLQPGVVANQEWQIAAVIDANGDNTPDIVWQHATEGWTVLWLMIATERIAAPNLPTLPAGWVIAGAK